MAVKVCAGGGGLWGGYGETMSMKKTLMNKYTWFFFFIFIFTATIDNSYVVLSGLK